MATINATPTTDDLLVLYKRMLLIRRIEETLRREAAAGTLPGAVHLYIGEEAIAVGVCSQLETSDWITSTHRGHGHFLAKGGEPRAMLAEIWAKRTGICKGMGGSMHVADFSKGILGANGIVGGGFAIATGAAYSAKLRKDNRIAVTFFGDGSTSEGVFMESLNISSLWKLPVIYVCENNKFSEFTVSSTVVSGEIADRARAFKIPTHVVDGNDIVAVTQAAADAVARARRGEGPTFIEAHTYRIQGHLEAEEFMLGGGRYRDKEQIQEWQAVDRDPIERAKTLLQDGGVSAAALSAIEDEVMNVVQDAVKFAEDSEPADPELAFDLMFVGRRA